MKNNPIYSDFWLGPEKYSNYLDSGVENNDELFSVDLIQLASVRRIISNYVSILTGKNIPVYFNAIGDSYTVGGNEIYISTEIRQRKDFDRAVGLALHEAAHTILTDFGRYKTIPLIAPKFIWDFARKNNIDKRTIEKFLKTIFNIIEDWYIDDWVLSRVPGYIGYYESSYNVCFNTPVIDQLLIGNDFRYPSLASYEFRIINFTNPLTDLAALPGLKEVADIIGISSISRLQTTSDRIETSFKVVDIVLKHLQEFHSNFTSNGTGTKKSKINVDNFFNTKPVSSKEKSSDTVETDKTIQDVIDTLAGRPKKEDSENKAIAYQISKSPDKEFQTEIKTAINAQLQYVHGNVKKGELNQVQKNMLDLIEKNGIVLVYVSCPVQGNEAAFKIGCIVVKNLSMELIAAGQDIFPLAEFWKDENQSPRPNAQTADSVRQGIILGTRLGKRILIRREASVLREVRKNSGRLNKRLIYSAGFGAEDLFEKIRINRFNKGSLHISVDASTSMKGKKWQETIKMTVAICKAMSMVDNVHVTVSFRATKNAKGIEMPYIVQAYDSKLDKFSKVASLFPYLCPHGCTPEGLAFGAIMELFTQISPDEEDRYFLNISDGEPYLKMKSPVSEHIFVYGDHNGVEHTKNQIAKIRRSGIRILGYYVDGGPPSLAFQGSEHDTKRNFQVMYGRDAKFIKTDDVVGLANTINDLFLRTV